MPSSSYSVRCVCPFYQCDAKMKINCADEQRKEDLISSISINFSSKKAKRIYTSEYCENINNYQNCDYYKSFNK